MAEYLAREADPKTNPPISASQAGALKSVQGEVTLDVALAAGDVLAMALVPAGHVPVDAIVDNDVLDSDGTPTIVVDVGDVDGAGNELMADSTLGQAASLSRMDAPGGSRLAPLAETNRRIGLTVTTGPATAATPATVTVTVFYRRSYRGS